MNPLEASYAAAITINTTITGGAAGTSGYFCYVGVGGDVSVDTLGGQTAVVFKNVPSGSILGNGLKIIKVNTAGTTATDLVAIR